MEWTETAPPITILKENITLPDYVLIDFSATSIRRVISFLNNEIGKKQKKLKKILF